jgi:hypothetical protein
MRLRVVDYRTPVAKEEDMSSKMDKTAKIRRHILATQEWM